MKQFEEYLIRIGKSENTALTYCRNIRMYFSWCRDSFGSEPKELYRSNVLEYISYMRNIRGYSPKSVNNHLSALRCLNKYKEILQWLKNAGVRLTVAELVYLIENGIKPTQDLLYTDNRQILIERIYTVDTIADNLLETRMEAAECRDAVVQSLLRLLKKKLVLVL